MTTQDQSMLVVGFKNVEDNLLFLSMTLLYKKVQNRLLQPIFQEETGKKL